MKTSSKILVTIVLLSGSVAFLHGTPYVTLNQNYSDYTFQGDTTYYISGPVNLSGTTTFEGGAVIKAGGSGQINIDASGTIVCKTGPYRPAVFTSAKDATIGVAVLSGSSAYGDANIFLNIAAPNVALHDLRFCYCRVGIDQGDGSIVASLSVTNCQFQNVDKALLGYNLAAYNVLIARSTNLDAAFVAKGPRLTAENVTADGGNSFFELDYSGATAALTNCLVTGQPLTRFPAVVQSNATVCLPTVTVPVYKTVGGGSYYLTNNSSYRDDGTTNIDAGLLAQLQQKTTVPPIMLVSNFTVVTTLSPQAQRDTNTPDIGFHYDPIDYMWTNLVAAQNVTLTNGVAVAFWKLLDAGWVASQGSVKQMNHIFPRSCVQESEQSNGSCFAIVWRANNLNFTAMSSLGRASTLIPWAGTFQNNTFQNITLYISAPGSFAGSPDDLPCVQIPMLVKNNVFERCNLTVESGDYLNDYYPGNDPDYFEFDYEMATKFYNNLFWNGSVTIFGNDYPCEEQLLSPDFSFYNNAFDNASTSINALWMDYADNADIGTSSSGVSDHYVSSFNYATGPLGPWYQASTDLIDEGTTNAGDLGLYWFTTQTNQVPETNSIVDIGFHYAVLDTNGLPLVFMFGVAQRGGVNDNGTIFELTPGGYEADIYSFAGTPDGWSPVGDLVLSGNTLYGVTTYGGANNNGTVFKINTDGSDYAILYSFTGGDDGAIPWAGLTLSGNTLYGTTILGGAADQGTIFKINTDGSGYTNIYTFGLTNYNDGWYPDDAPLLLINNTLYGTTDGGGPYYDGNIFRINTDGSGFTNIYYFDDLAAYNPRGRLVLVTNTLYGVTALGGNGNAGIIYSINTNGSNYQVVHDFGAFPGDGQNTYAGLLLVNNTLYGTTIYGGANQGPEGIGSGTVYSFEVGNAAGTYKVLQSLPDNFEQYSGSGPLLLRGNLLYGMTGGGFYTSGFVFSLNLNGSNFIDIYDVGTNPNDGVLPIGGLCSP